MSSVNFHNVVAKWSLQHCIISLFDTCYGSIGEIVNIFKSYSKKKSYLIYLNQSNFASVEKRTKLLKLLP